MKSFTPVFVLVAVLMFCQLPCALQLCAFPHSFSQPRGGKNTLSSFDSGKPQMVVCVYVCDQIIKIWGPNHFHGHVYKIKHLGIMTASTNICERMGYSQKLS